MLIGLFNRFRLMNMSISAVLVAVAATVLYLEPGEISQAAREYFGLRNFACTFDPELYGQERHAYIHTPDRGGRYDTAVISPGQREVFTTVTAVAYSAPLHMIPERLITYTLQKRADVE